MMNRSIFCLLLLVLCSNAVASEKPPQVTISGSAVHQLQSKIVDQTYQIDVLLPPGYTDSERHYPTVYVTDSDVSFPLVAGHLAMLALAGELQDLIVVGIGYQLPFVETQSQRERDLTPIPAGTGKRVKDSMGQSGHSAEFLRFINEELKTFINRTYRTEPKNQTFMGYSYGGLFGLYVLFNHTESFDRYVIGSPAIWWGDKISLKYEEGYAKTHQDLAKRVFLSIGQREHRSTISDMETLVGKLKSRAYPGLRLGYHQFSGDTHDSGIGASLSHGLRFVFDRQPPAPLRTVEVTQQTDSNFADASFSLHLPQGVTQPDYILALAPGLDGDGNELLADPRWMTLAEGTNAAIVTSSFKLLPIDKNFVHYAAAHLGSGAALESAIAEMDHGDLDLASLPLLFYGHSAGGQFAYGFTSYRPKRMIGFVAIKGGYYYPSPIAGTYEVPGLIISGHGDKLSRREAIRGLFESHRAKGARWCWLEDAHGHGLGETTSLAIPYLRSLLAQLPANDGLPDRAQLSGFYVDMRSKQIVGKVATGQPAETSWLPSQTAFEAWVQQDVGAERYQDLTPDPGQEKP